jgi:hypothetical protein
MANRFVVQAMQFNGLNDYLAIVEWMKEAGDTHALADEVYYSTPEMAIQTERGRISARPGDWIVKGLNGIDRFEVLSPPAEPTSSESVNDPEEKPAL